MVKGKIMDKFAKEGTPLKVVYDPTADGERTKQSSQKEAHKQEAHEAVTERALTEPALVETKPTETKPTVKPEIVNDLSKPTKKNAKIEGEVLVVMRVLAENGIAEVSSTLLRDKLGLKKGGRGAVRRAMRKMEAEGKVVIGQKAIGKQKQFTYRLKE